MRQDGCLHWSISRVQKVDEGNHGTQSRTEVVLVITVEFRLVVDGSKSRLLCLSVLAIAVK